MWCCAAEAIKRFDEGEKERTNVAQIQLKIFPPLFATMKLHCPSNCPFSSIFDVNENWVNCCRNCVVFSSSFLSLIEIRWNVHIKAKRTRNFSRSNQFNDRKFISKSERLDRSHAPAVLSMSIFIDYLVANLCDLNTTLLRIAIIDTLMTCEIKAICMNFN